MRPFLAMPNEGMPQPYSWGFPWKSIGTETTRRACECATSRGFFQDRLARQQEEKCAQSVNASMARKRARGGVLA